MRKAFFLHTLENSRSDARGSSTRLCLPSLQIFHLVILFETSNLLRHMTSRRTKGKSKSKEDTLASEEALILDPYVAIAKPSCICTAEGIGRKWNISCCQHYIHSVFVLYCLIVDHARRKNCVKNPWCVYGLGEKEGIWKSNAQLLNCIGYDPSVNQRKKREGIVSPNRLFPPAGLKNLGATCYLNVLIQVG